jgi:hypothetical protein
LRKRYAPAFSGTKAYYTEADPSVQELYGIVGEEFDAKAKLWLLLFDHVILSAGHMLGSPVTFAWLEANLADVALLAESDAMLPSLRDDRDDLRDYASRRDREWEEPWAERLPASAFVERARVLDDVFGAAITWSAASESSFFRDSMVADLGRPWSPLRRRLVGLSNRRIEALCDSLRDTELLTRRAFVSLAKTTCPRHHRVLRRYADVFYHCSGALEKEAMPLLHHEEGLLCCESVSDEVSQVLGVEPAELWQMILASWGLTASALSDLPMSELVQMRNDHLGKRVRKTFARVLDNARASRGVEDVMDKHLAACRALNEEFKREHGRQGKSYARRKRWRGAIDVTVWVTSGLATVAGLLTRGPLTSMLGTVTGLLGLVTGRLVLDHFEERLPGTELVLLAARLQGSAAP